MKEAIAEANRRIEECRAEIKKLNDFIRAAQAICDHVWEDAPDLHDYHKREDFVRCEKCGFVR